MGHPKKLIKPIANGKYDPKLPFRSGLGHFWTTGRRRRPKKNLANFSPIPIAGRPIPTKPDPRLVPSLTKKNSAWLREGPGHTGHVIIKCQKTPA